MLLSDIFKLKFIIKLAPHSDVLPPKDPGNVNINNQTRSTNFSVYFYTFFHYILLDSSVSNLRNVAHSLVFTFTSVQFNFLSHCCIVSTFSMFGKVIKKANYIASEKFSIFTTKKFTLQSTNFLIGWLNNTQKYHCRIYPLNNNSILMSAIFKLKSRAKI